MAEGRMLKKRISQSHKFATLKSHNARLLYLMLIPHLDIKGRFEADPKIVKGIVVPLLNFSKRKILEYLRDLHACKLIKLYKINDQWYLEATKFANFQSLRENHEAKSQCPDPTNNNTTPDSPFTPNTTPISTTDQLQELVSPIKVKLSKVKESKYSEEFEVFWKKFKGRYDPDNDRYIKVGKWPAFEEWEKLSPEQQTHATAAADRVRGKYVPDARRWLKNRLFDDFT